MMDLELFALKTLAYLIAIAGALFIAGMIGALIWGGLHGKKDEPKSRQNNSMSSCEEVTWKSEPKSFDEHLSTPKPASFKSYEIPKSVQALPESKPIVPAPSPEELKQKAIKQIMGRN